MKIEKFHCTLFCISAFLYAARYIAAAILASGEQNPFFSSSYSEIGAGLTVWAWIALVAALLGPTLRYLKVLADEPPAEIVDEVNDIVEKAGQAATKTDSNTDA